MTILYYRNNDGRYVGAFDTPQPDLIECDPPADARQVWDDALGAWGVIPEEFPFLTSRQFWLAAFSIGITKQQLLDAVEQSEQSDYDKAYLKIELSESTTFERDNPSIEFFANLVGTPTKQLDTLWVWAANL